MTMMLRERRESHKVMNECRKYWRDPRLASQLSKEQRQKITEKFLELMEKSKEENVIRMSKTMKGRIKLLPFLTKEMRKKGIHKT